MVFLLVNVVYFGFWLNQKIIYQGFKIPELLYEDISEITDVPYPKLLAIFVQATYNQLVEFQTQRTRLRPDKKAKPNSENQPQIQVLFAKLISIRQVLNGLVTIPSNEVLCEWVHFCYDFELYREGQLLFELVSPEQVNPWYYERTKKLARLCSMRSAAKD